MRRLKFRYVRLLNMKLLACPSLWRKDPAKSHQKLEITIIFLFKSECAYFNNERCLANFEWNRMRFSRFGAIDILQS